VYGLPSSKGSGYIELKDKECPDIIKELIRLVTEQGEMMKIPKLCDRDCDNCVFVKNMNYEALHPIFVKLFEEYPEEATSVIESICPVLAKLTEHYPFVGLEPCSCDCNTCSILLHKNYKVLPIILNILDFTQPVSEIVSGSCVNLTVCPECRMDDLTHVEGCMIDKVARSLAEEMDL